MFAIVPEWLLRFARSSDASAKGSLLRVGSFCFVLLIGVLKWKQKRPEFWSEVSPLQRSFHVAIRHPEDRADACSQFQTCFPKFVKSQIRLCEKLTSYPHQHPPVFSPQSHKKSTVSQRHRVSGPCGTACDSVIPESPVSIGHTKRRWTSTRLPRLPYANLQKLLLWANCFQILKQPVQCTRQMNNGGFVRKITFAYWLHFKLARLIPQSLQRVGFTFNRMQADKVLLGMNN